MAWLLSLLLSILKPLGSWALGILTKDLVDMIKKAYEDYMSKKEADRIAKENLQKYKEAIEKGDLDAQAKAGQDILNGSKPNP